MAERNAGNVLVPLTLVGLGLLFLGGGGQSEPPPSPQPLPPPPPPGPQPGSQPTEPIRPFHPSQPGSGQRFKMYMGPPQSRYTAPVYISPEEMVLVTVDFCDGKQCTLVRLNRPFGVQELHLVEPPQTVLNRLGITKDKRVKVNQPTGKTEPKVTEDEWALEDEDESMEVVPIWIHRPYIKMIGPSSTVHYKRRRLGKIYTTDGLALELYESLSILRKIVGPGVPETNEPFPRRVD